MTVRRARRIGYALAGGYLTLVAALNARPLSYLLLLLRYNALRAQNPEMFDGSAASTAVTKVLLEERLALATQTYQAQLETSRRGYEIELDEEFMRQLDEDLGKAYSAMELLWLELKMVTA